jgi:hypothetical protein
LVLGEVECLGECVEVSGRDSLHRERRT